MTGALPGDNSPEVQIVEVPPNLVRPPHVAGVRLGWIWPLGPVFCPWNRFLVRWLPRVLAAAFADRTDHKES